jgi:3-oxoacyl-[acyl-carrier-protein] synthase-3
MESFAVAPISLEPAWTPAFSAKPLRGVLNANVLGTGSAVPEQVVGNDYFVDALKLQTTSQWIRERTGIIERRKATTGETAAQFAVEAARFALAKAKLSPTQIDAIVVATSSPDLTMPTAACLVQGQLGATRAMAFDVANACSGFVYALDIAARYVQTGFNHVLVVGVDLGSRLLNYEDRGTCVFFGDGAGAVVLGAEGSGRILASRLYSAGDASPLSLPVGGTMRMDGREVWNIATRALPATVRQLCEDASVSVNDLRLLVPHQANRNIIAASAAELGLPLSRVAINIEHYGNTLAASIPLALDEALAQGRASRGDLVALVGFGAGLAWGGQLLEL